MKIKYISKTERGTEGIFENSIVIKQIKFNGYSNRSGLHLQISSMEDHLAGLVQTKKQVPALKNAGTVNNPAPLINFILNSAGNYTKDEAVVMYKFVQDIIYDYGKEYPDLLKLGEASFLFFHDLLNGKNSSGYNNVNSFNSATIL